MGHFLHPVPNTSTFEQLDRGGEDYTTGCEAEGSGIAVLSNLLAECHGDYGALVTTLENHFSAAHQAELHRMKLRNREKGGISCQTYGRF